MYGNLEGLAAVCCEGSPLSSGGCCSVHNRTVAWVETSGGRLCLMLWQSPATLCPLDLPRPGCGLWCLWWWPTESRKTPRSEAVLTVAQYGVTIKVVHYLAMDDMFQYLAWYRCQQDWSVIGGLMFVTFLEDWYNRGWPPVIGYDAWLKGRMEYLSECSGYLVSILV